MTKDEQKEQAILLREGSGFDCYAFANIPGADTEKLQARAEELKEQDD